MKLFLLFVLIFLFGCSSKENGFSFQGETAYIKDENESLNTQLNSTYRKNIYETKNKKYLIHLKGLLVTDYNHFNGEIKNNVFTTLGIEF